MNRSWSRPYPQINEQEAVKWLRMAWKWYTKLILPCCLDPALSREVWFSVPSSLMTKASVWTLSQNLYVSQQTNTGTLYDLATRAISEVPTRDITYPLAIRLWAPKITLETWGGNETHAVCQLCWCVRLQFQVEQTTFCHISSSLITCSTKYGGEIWLCLVMSCRWKVDIHRWWWLTTLLVLVSSCDPNILWPVLTLPWQCSSPWMGSTQKDSEVCHHAQLPVCLSKTETVRP